jgi:hypothetical protein
MKLVLMLTMMFQFLMPIDLTERQLLVDPVFQAEIDFDEQVKKGYESYVILEAYETPDFKLKIVQGINGNEVNAGVLLFNNKPQAYIVQANLNDRIYELPQTSRGDYIAPAIKLGDDLVINVHNGISNVHSVEVIALTIEEFKTTHENIITGENQGVKSVKLQNVENKLTDMGTIALIFTGIIIAIGLIILVFYLKKKGVFSEKSRKENVFDFQKYANEHMARQNEYVLDESDYAINDVNIHQNPEPTEFKPVYERQRYYEDEYTVVDVEQILKDKGYNTDYESALEIEKNEIMLELMKLRDYKEITPEQYREETIKLWKK